MGLIFGCSTIVVAFSLISLAFLIVATITAPATSALGLAEAESIRYGVFGYCYTTNSTCVTGSPFYDVSSITSLNDWKMDDSARDTLVKIMIVTPIAAGLTLISLLFNFFAHFRTFGDSVAFYIVAFVFALLAFIAAAITVIVTFLLFYPHVKWPAWLLIGPAVLNLISVPLVFFAMRTSPSSTSHDDDESADDKNLTDLSDGGNFKAAESFRLNDYHSTHSYPQYSTEKFIPEEPTIKVITDDSSLNADQFEKVSVHDYSRPGDAGSNAAYRNYQDSSVVDAFTEGTPNLVSAQNYNKGGAVISEAPSFHAQSINPETATGYPSTVNGSFASQSSSNELLLDHPEVVYSQDTTSSHSRAISSHQAKSQANDITATDGETTPYPHSVFQITSDSNALTGSSAMVEDTDYGNDINDNDSDFTSVSQRAANPRYYRNFQQGPSLFPVQPAQQQFLPQQQVSYQQQPVNYQQQGNYQPQPQQQQQYQYQPQQVLQAQGSHLSYGGYSEPQTMPYQQQQHQQQPAVYQQRRASQQAPQTTINTTDYLLSHNPDFAVGGAAFQKPNSKRPGNTPLKPLAGGYRPAYKKRINSGNRLPAASLSSDSPYNIR